ncbi:hypothetical protein SIO70_00840 [Chitinophaga sancti]|uniref:hypothetical protein n=1 Tax=Chitinophaga sancti TaxID=1004 RepID=UPI002A7483C5|nr:hypothetical protein [Chitinophaga sancti]WPQ63408.1 hypothetical protein SIO70_00840 [Chitinophaga sancti]
MSIEKKLMDRVTKLLELANKVIESTKYPQGIGIAKVNRESFNEFRTASLSFIKNIYGESHSYYTDFDGRVTRSEPSCAEIGRGIIRAIKSEIEDNWLMDIKGLISADIFADFLEMAGYLLSENYKDPAAVMVGSVLEEHLRQLCNKYSISITENRGGKIITKKADTLNAELYKANVYNALDHKNVTAWLDLRNKAAHGQYTTYNKTQVEGMLQGVLEFISRNRV